MILNIEQYKSTKDLLIRNNILTAAVLSPPENGEEFFLAAFKKERYLDMKLAAIRCYAEYASEEEVNTLMSKMLELLKKRALTTKNDYQVYEPMRSPFLMPYLLEKYNYKCFRDFSDQLKKQYDAMDDEWKGIFTLDEKGKLVELRRII